MKIVIHTFVIISIFLAGFPARSQPPGIDELKSSAYIAIDRDTTDMNRHFLITYIVNGIRALEPPEQVVLLNSVLDTLHQSENEADERVLGSQVVSGMCLLGLAFLATRSMKTPKEWPVAMVAMAVSSLTLGSLFYAERDAKYVRKYIASVRAPLVELRDSTTLKMRADALR